MSLHCSRTWKPICIIVVLTAAAFEVQGAQVQTATKPKISREGVTSAARNRSHHARRRAAVGPPFPRIHHDGHYVSLSAGEIGADLWAGHAATVGNTPAAGNTLRNTAQETTQGAGVAYRT
jgi:hypothetical protein